MATLQELIRHLEKLAPPSLQESYDNSGLITGDPSMEISGVLVCLDALEEVIDEAMENGCNVVVAHHPILFSGLRSLTGKNYVERVLLKAIRNHIAIYAVHTNLDNVSQGVNRKMGEKLGLLHLKILRPMPGRIMQMVTYCPADRCELVKDALFAAGAGHIGRYSECAFVSDGTGSFKGEEGSNPVVGKVGVREESPEKRIELIFPDWKERDVLLALRQAHPYEEIAYSVSVLHNANQSIGAGMIGELPSDMEATSFLDQIKEKMGVAMLRHTALPGKKVRQIAICGGSGSFLLPDAIRANADVLVTADFKYHQFFDAEGRILIADIGHFESERFTIDLLGDEIRKKFTTFAVRLTGITTNPIHYR